jgi:hypothetical protein
LEQPFVAKKISKFKFSIKVGCVRYMHVKGFLNLKFLSFSFICFICFSAQEGGRGVGMRGKMGAGHLVPV